MARLYSFASLSAVVVSLGACDFSQHDVAPETTPAHRPNLESFDLVWETVRDNYFDPELNGVDWKAARDELRPKIRVDTSVDEVREILEELVGRLEVSHFKVIPGDLYLDPGPTRIDIGISARIVDNEAFVVRVAADSPADQLGVKRGWRVVSVDGSHTNIASRLVNTFRDSDAKLDVEFEFDGIHERFEISSQPRGEKVSFSGKPDRYVWIESSRLAGDIGYIHFNAIEREHVQPLFNQAVLRFVVETRGLIIDVRGVSGGQLDVVTSMMGWFLKCLEVEIGTKILRGRQETVTAWQRPLTYDQPVVILIDEKSYSGAELFAQAMKEADCARIIGNQTDGRVMSSRFIVLPNRDGFQFAVGDLAFAGTGKSLEGAGVTPHQIVLHTRDALLNDRDLQLEAAMEWLEEQTR